jgi:membrane protein
VEPDPKADPSPSRWLSGALIVGAIAAAWAIETPRRGVARSRAAAAGLRAAMARRAARQAPDGAAVHARTVAAGASAWRMPWPWWRAVLSSTYREIGEDRLLAVAAGVVFYALLALFPAVTAFVSFYGLFASYATIDDHLFLLSYVLPAGGLDIVRDQVSRIVSNPQGGLSFAFVAGLAIALWSANAGVKAMIDALNVIEGAPERRSFVRLNAVSLGFTLGVIVFMLVAVGAVVAFPLVMSMFGMREVTSAAAWLVRWPLLVAAVLLLLAVLYRFGPNVERRRWRILTPGVVFAVFAWLAGSAGLSFYLSSFADYNATYGSLGAAIGLMMWMWLTTIVILVGAELDSEIEKALSAPA